jgi:hypothetical protein
MITVIKRGKYQLCEIGNKKTLLCLGSVKRFLWETSFLKFFDSSNSTIENKKVKSQGKFFLYDVQNEPKFTSSQHLEMLVEKNAWQGYLLPQGLPNKNTISKNIFPVQELITTSLKAKIVEFNCI